VKGYSNLTTCRFLYQGREVSYSSVLARSISARREALYKTRGFDIDRWMDLVGEKKALRAEIGRIARDYEGDDEKGKVDLEDESHESEDGGAEKNVVEEETEQMLNGGKSAKSGETPDLDEKEVKVDPDEQVGKRKSRKANESGL